MTVIAWDGKILAADKQGQSSGTISTATKIAVKGNTVYATTGTEATGALLIQWHQNGSDPERWPECQKEEYWSEMIILKDGKIMQYEKWPIALELKDRYFAWGAGRDFAIGAMASGANVIEAVNIAIKHDNSCGVGVDWYTTENGGYLGKSPYAPTASEGVRTSSTARIRVPVNETMVRAREDIFRACCCED